MYRDELEASRIRIGELERSAKDGASMERALSRGREHFLLGCCAALIAGAVGFGLGRAGDDVRTVFVEEPPSTHVPVPRPDPWRPGGRRTACATGDEVACQVFAADLLYRGEVERAEVILALSRSGSVPEILLHP